MDTLTIRIQLDQIESFAAQVLRAGQLRGLAGAADQVRLWGLESPQASRPEEPKRPLRKR